MSYAVGKLSQYLSEPRQQHWVAAKHILKYLRSTSHYELRYQKNEELGILAYSDADWASDQSGFCFYLNRESSPILWKSKKQPTIALSTCESEYMARAKTTQESLYLIQLLNGMDPQQRYEPAKILGDNQGAIALCKDPVNRQRCKHIDIKYHFIRDALHKKKIEIIYCPTTDMIADIMTKPMTKLKLERFKRLLFGL